MRSQAFFALAAGLATTTTAHTIFVQLESGGTTYDVSYGIRDPSYLATEAQIRLQLRLVSYMFPTYVDEVPLRSLSHLLYNSAQATWTVRPERTVHRPSDIIDVTAGSTVSAVWRHTLTSDATDVIDSSHLGPTLAYLKKVDDATTDTGIGDGWFKIYEDGYTNGVWGTTNVINNAGEQEIPIPDCIEDGEYLLRAEMIALHAASSSQGAQLYMECAQISISGGKGTVSPTTYSIPGIYSATDPGLLINIYSMTSSSTYTIPGPDVFTCAA
ncbi:putative Endo-beta-1,4-glucanase D [Seiridium unicorne]|uniref:lytic cellulose monooxygenase (C4-dehydrogenating) n=1 Tax=Seiridium unicorne TaxID=138068 RepID=A0ABR2VGI3_9PEZI